MMGHGYTYCHYDNCVYFQQVGDPFIYLLLYVVDMLFAFKDKSLICELKSQLSNEFEMKDLGANKKILGMEIHRDRNGSKLYLGKVLDRFNMSNCKLVTNPLTAYFKLSAESCPASKKEIKKMSHVPYSSVLGSLMYTMVCTRPDFSYAISVVSRRKDHWKAIKWIL